MYQDARGLERDRAEWRDRRWRWLMQMCIPCAQIPDLVFFSRLPAVDWSETASARADGKLLKGKVLRAREASSYIQKRWFILSIKILVFFHILILKRVVLFATQYNYFWLNVSETWLYRPTQLRSIIHRSIRMAKGIFRLGRSSLLCCDVLVVLEQDSTSQLVTGFQEFDRSLTFGDYRKILSQF